MATGFFLINLALQKIGYVDPPVDTSGDVKAHIVEAENEVEIPEKAIDGDVEAKA